MTPDLTSYPDYQTLTDYLQWAARQRPDLCRLHSIGRSPEGRDIWCLEVTNFATGPGESKPGFHADGQHHAGEVTGAVVCLHLIDRLLSGYGTDPAVTEILDSRCLTVVPRLTVDGSELYLKTPATLRSAPRPDPVGEEPAGLVPEDVDGDGLILQMRIPDPDGPWKVSAADPRLMVRRRVDDRTGPFYRLVTEGRLAGSHAPGVPWRVAGPRHGLDFNRNYPNNWAPEPRQRGSGPYPLSEAETRAHADFIRARGNIAVAMSYHTAGGVILRPLTTDGDHRLPAEDRAVFAQLAERAEELTGYPTWSIYERFTADRERPTVGSYVEWMYEGLGALCLATELWDMRGRAGLPKRSVAEALALGERQREEEGLALLRWNDRELGGEGFVPWRPFRHSQLGEVEIGGWRTKTVVQNAPARLLPDECRRNVDFALVLAAATPWLRILAAEAERLGPDVWRVSATVANRGFLPTYVTEMARRARVDRRPRVRLRGVEAEVHELEHLQGRSTGRETPADCCRRVSWTVRAAAGQRLTVEVEGGPAGGDRVTLQLG